MKRGMRHYAIELSTRMGIAILLAAFREVFYLAFAPLTLYLSYFFFHAFVPEAMLSGKFIETATASVEFVPACTASSAYLLLALLILLTKDISPVRRIKMFAYGSLAILTFNIFRIELLLLLFTTMQESYPAIHLLFWKFLSTIFVFAAWIVLARKFKVKAIPAYSDIKYLVHKIKNK